MNSILLYCFFNSNIPYNKYVNKKGVFDTPFAGFVAINTIDLKLYDANKQRFWCTCPRLNETCHQERISYIVWLYSVNFCSTMPLLTSEIKNSTDFSSKFAYIHVEI